MSHWLMAAEVATSLINLGKYIKSFIVKEVVETKEEIDETTKDVKELKEEVHTLNEKLEKLLLQSQKTENTCDNSQNNNNLLTEK
jgi:hypothetical protein